MAERPKRYYWLMLDKDFFRQKEIKKLRKIAGGDTYTVIYLKMQLLSLKNAGVLIFQGVEDTFADEVALEIDENVENVKVTIAFLSRYKLLLENDNSEYLLLETIKAIGSETAGAERVRRHREQRKALQCNASVTLVKQNCNVETTETEREIDIYKTNNEGSTDGGVCQDVNFVDNSVSDDDVVVVCKKMGLEVTGIVLGLVEKYGKEAVLRQLHNMEKGKNVQNKIGWLQSALKNNYATNTNKYTMLSSNKNCEYCNGVGKIKMREEDSGIITMMNCPKCCVV